MFEWFRVGLQYELYHTDKDGNHYPVVTVCDCLYGWAIWYGDMRYHTIFAKLEKAKAAALTWAEEIVQEEEEEE